MNTKIANIVVGINVSALLNRTTVCLTFITHTSSPSSKIITANCNSNTSYLRKYKTIVITSRVCLLTKEKQVFV